MKEEAETRVQETIDFYFGYYPRMYEFYVTAKYFHYPDTERERLVANADPFFVNVAYASWALVVVDLCKIFIESKNQRYNIVTLLKDIKTKPEFSATLAKLGTPLLDEYIEKIRLQQPTIQKLHVLRDKHYAHIDNVKQNLNELKNPTFRETEALLDLLKEIVFGIGERVLDAHYEFPTLRELDRLTPRAIVQDVTKQRSQNNSQ